MFGRFLIYMLFYLMQVEIYAQQLNLQSFAQNFLFVEYNGFVLVEAEDLSYSSNWQFLSERKGFTGRGYLKWTGGTQGQGEGQETDHIGKLQGNPDDWLVIPVQVTKTGVYHVDLRNTHDNRDEGNDVWVHVIGWPPPVRRMGDHGEKTFQWLTWGPDEISWKITRKGLYHFYIAGRSNYFAIDRIAIYHEDAPVKLKDKAMPASRKYNQSGLK